MRNLCTGKGRTGYPRHTASAGNLARGHILSRPGLHGAHLLLDVGLVVRERDPSDKLALIDGIPVEALDLGRSSGRSEEE